MRASFTCSNCLVGLRRSNIHKSPLATSRSSIWIHRWSSSDADQSVRLKRRIFASHGRQRFQRSRSLSTQSPIPRGEPGGPPKLQPDDLFHPFTHSPIPEIRHRAKYMKAHAFCPHPSHRPTRQPTSPYDLEARKVLAETQLPPATVQFECPDCGIPVACSEEHWADDYENHMDICDTLRQINEDDHDLRSGRVFPEFDYPGPSLEEAVINMTNWDTYLYTREFNAINEERSMRQATRLLTYPLTIASVLHELSPYNIRKGGRLTVEGLKSFSGSYYFFRYCLYPYS